MYVVCCMGVKEGVVEMEMGMLGEGVDVFEWGYYFERMMFEKRFKVNEWIRR